MKNIITVFLLVVSSITIIHSAWVSFGATGRLMCHGVPYTDAIVRLYNWYWLKYTYYSDGIVDQNGFFFVKHSVETNNIHSISPWLYIKHKCTVFSIRKWSSLKIHDKFLRPRKELDLVEDFGNIKLYIISERSQ